MPLVNSVGFAEPGNAPDAAISFSGIESFIEPGHDPEGNIAVNTCTAHIFISYVVDYPDVSVGFLDIAHYGFDGIPVGYEVVEAVDGICE